MATEKALKALEIKSIELDFETLEKITSNNEYVNGLITQLKNKMISRFEKGHIPDVSGQCHKLIEKQLGNRKRRFLIWHDGGQWMVSMTKDENNRYIEAGDQSRTLKEIVYGIDA